MNMHFVAYLSLACLHYLLNLLRFLSNLTMVVFTTIPSRIVEIVISLKVAELDGRDA